MIAITFAAGLVLFAVGVLLAARARRAGKAPWLAYAFVLLALLAFVPYSIWYYQRVLG